jgi:hypothetical protein
MEFIFSLIFTIPGALILIALGILLIRYIHKDIKRKRENDKDNFLFAIGIEGYAAGGGAIILGLIILFGLIFQK